MLRIWGRKSSSNVQAVMWCVAELGLAHERVDAGFTYGVNDTPEFLAMNPNGKIPVVQDNDGMIVWESGAILRHLCNRYGAGPFWPEDLAQRTQVDMWAEWAKINIAAGFTGPIFWRVVRTAPKEQDPAEIRAAISALSERLDIADRRLASQAYLAGDAFSLADIQFGHLLYRYYNIAIERPEHAAVARYYDRLCERAAYQEHVMVSYEELRVT